MARADGGGGGIAMPDITYDAVRDFVYLEADLLDRREWDLWLDLYVEDCVYWVPSWASEDELTEDPELEVNMIYLKGKPSLEATSPLARTSHLVNSIRLLNDKSETIEVSAKWMTLSSDPRWGKQIRGGWYDFQMCQTSSGLRIARKKIVLLESAIDGAIDIHQI